MPSIRTASDGRVAFFIVVLVLAGCSSGEDASSPEPDGAPTSIESVTVTSHDENSLLATLEVELSDSESIKVDLSGNGHEFTVPTGDAATEHVVALAGVHADTNYQVTVSLDSDRTDSVEWRTGPLPEGLPEIETIPHDPSRVQPGDTLFTLVPPRLDGSGEPTDEDAYLLITDTDGQVIWYHSTPGPLGDSRMLEEGTILYDYDLGARLIDPLTDEVLTDWSAVLGRDENSADDPIPVDVDSIHHEVSPLPNGNLIALSTEVQRIDGFDSPQCGESAADFDGGYDLIGDLIVEFDPATGEIASRTSLFDLIDPRTMGPAGSVCGLLAAIPPTSNYVDQPGLADVRDWSHGNAVVLNESTNTLLVSVRHLDWVLGIRYEDDDAGPAGELLWRFGIDGDIPLEEGEFPLHQHAPEIQEDGTVLLYDNGNQRPGTDSDPASPDGPPNYSRAVLYDIDVSAADPEAWSATQLWEWRTELDGELIDSGAVGDADRMANGNVLVTNGILFGEPDGLSAQIVEVDPIDGPSGAEIVSEIRIGGGSWIVYRAERIPSVYGRTAG